MADLSDLVREWASESAFIKQKFFGDHAEPISVCARAIAERLVGGGKLLAFGNGGSATDAQHIAVEFTNPVIKERPPLPAICLSADVALVTSLANDFAFDEIFCRQVEVYAQPNDVLIGLSTSGSSANVVRALEVGKARGLLCVALTGKGGGRCMEIADFAFAVPSHNILRIQECHLTLYHILWDMVHTLLHYEPELGRARAQRADLANEPGKSAKNDDTSAAAAGPSADETSPDPALAELYPFLFDK